MTVRKSLVTFRRAASGEQGEWKAHYDESRRGIGEQGSQCCLLALEGRHLTGVNIY